MIDIALVRSNPEIIAESLEKRGEDPALVEQLAELDQKWRHQNQILEALQAERNVLSKTKQSAFEHRSRLGKLKREIESTDEKAKKIQGEVFERLAIIPNILAHDVPTGKSAADNKVVEKVGKVTKKEGRSHDELMSALGWLDLETAALSSGARYRYLLDQGAIALRKLFDEAIRIASEAGYKQVVPPVICRSEALQATGFFPRGIEDTFKVEDDQYLSGTSEPMLLALGAGHSVRRGQPLRFVGVSTCFRREAGSYGKDTKGMFRMHQFEKVELVSICHPSESEKEFQAIIELQENLVRTLDIPYQKTLLCSADQGHIAMKQYDIEAWFPSQGCYRETHSASNCGDYQARSLKIKLDGEPGLAHTLNGTLATERLLLAVVENNQNDDGSVTLPAILKSGAQTS